jgi:hypothetical protein
VVRALLRFCVVAMVASAFAQDVRLQASVDRATVRNNESFTYTIRAEGSVRSEPEDSALAQQFDVLQRSSSSRVQIVNGQTSQVTEWQYQLMPKADGEFTLPPLRVGDRQTNAVTLRVLAPEPSGAAPADIFIELEAQPHTVYVQSQVLFTLRLFIGVSTGRATLTAPEISGGEAILERLGEDTQYQTERGGRAFIVRERRYAVFPQQSGSLTIGPATFEAMVIPDRGFSRVQRFRSSTLDLAVQPAVPPPASLTGAVWLPAQRVTLTEEWSDESADLAVGIPRTRRIVIEGEGLLETQLPDVPIMQQPGIRQYPDQPDLTRELTAQGLKSRRSVSLAVIAQAPGEFTLAGVRLPWWNVTAERWEVAELPPRTLRIEPSGETPPADVLPLPVEVAAAPAATPARSWWPIVTGVFALAWAVTALLWWRARSSGAARPQRAEPASPSERRPAARKVLRDLNSACAVNDPGGARRLLLRWGEAHFPADPPRSLGALAALLPQGLAREVLALEAHIYGAAPGVWDGQSLMAALADLEAAGANVESAKGEPLLPLYR